MTLGSLREFITRTDTCCSVPVHNSGHWRAVTVVVVIDVRRNVQHKSHGRTERGARVD